MSNSETVVTLTPAWLLELTPQCKVALGDGSVEEYIRDSKLYSIPSAVEHCNELLMWRERLVPVIDFNVIFNEPGLSNQHIVVLAYQEYSGQTPQYVGIKLHNEVQRITVNDSSACDWPAEYPLQIQPLVESLFISDDELISVINVSDLCNEGYRDYLKQLNLSNI